jgi:photosystem II stability/assembly factor-like uncharacterized protein
MSTRTANLFRFFVAVPLLSIFVSVSRAQSGWVPFKINTGGNDLNTVYFLDSKRGWVGGDGGFLSRTDDGGQSWVRQTVPTTAGINDIYFRDKEAGFLLAGNSIFITRDGTNWTQSRIFLPEEFEGADVELYSVRFASKKKGWVVGSISKRERVVDSILVYTDDGGETWRRQRAPSRLELIHIDFVSDKRGWIVGDGGTILFTRDGGASWSKQNVGTITSTLYHIDFRDDKKGWAVGERGTLLRTTDGGETWTVVPTNVNVTLLSVQFLSDEEGWAIGRGGTILRSSDEGKTWVRQESTTKQNLYSLIFNKKIGWVVGGAGIVLRYDRS